MSSTSGADFTPFSERMEADGLPQIAIDAFHRAFDYVASGGQTLIPESSITPLEEPTGLADLDAFEAAGEAALGQAVVIKLNGGLGTSMGLSAAKSLLPVRGDLSFLDLIAQQLIHARQRWNVQLPLLLMNSYRTRDDSLATLARHADLAQDLPLDFVQHRVPRIEADTLKPVTWPADPSLEWCPPGHGDIYIALASSGMLDQLLAAGIRYAFISNADNLGAVLEPRILGWMAERGIPFAMEVTTRTPGDKKGGHLARRDGQLILRETAQCAPEDVATFQDVSTHRFFSTNNLWLDLQVLKTKLEATPGGLPLPIIRNEKRVVAGDESTPRCLQLETAMGSAVECYADAQAIAVPRQRFAPVKTCNDLLTVWSDAYTLTDDVRLVPTDMDKHARRLIDLDSRYFGHVQDLQARFPDGPPSLLNCESLSVRGDYRFGAEVTVEGRVSLTNDSGAQQQIPDGARLS